LSSYETLIAFGWNAERAGQFTSFEAAGLRPARVTGVDRSLCDAVGPEGPLRVAYDFRDKSRTPCTGDWIAYDPEAVHGPGGSPWLEAVLPRHGTVTRSTASRKSTGQVLAANLDAALIVVPLDVDPDIGRIERFLTLVWDSGARPVVVLTKADLAPNAAETAAEVAEAAPGADVLTVSAHTGDGLDVLRAVLGVGVGDAPTLALLGPSGAGKSSLANALAGEDLLAVQEVRSADGKGRHTSTRRELVRLPGGGLLIDTPGLRGVGLFSLDDGLEMTFSDVEAYAADCRFGDCSHEAEPGCAVQAALASGELPERRMDSYRKLRKEAEWMASREDSRLRNERERKWKVIHKEMRRTPSPKK
jgi:ribosome biogenesis GTPase